MKLIIPFFFIVLAPGTITTAGQGTQPVMPGKVLFESKCQKCHGADGTKGLFGAKNLQISRLNDAELATIITEGRKIMPSWKKRLTPEQVNQVIDYIKLLRK